MRAAQQLKSSTASHPEMTHASLGSQAAQADLDEVRRLDPLQPGLHQQEQRLQQLISRSKASDHALIQQMLPA